MKYLLSNSLSGDFARYRFAKRFSKIFRILLAVIVAFGLSVLLFLLLTSFGLNTNEANWYSGVLFGVAYSSFTK